MNRFCVYILTALFSLTASAGVQEGITALNKGDFKKAYKEFLPIAESGDPKAMIQMGLFYHEGKGVKQDYRQAMDWYVKAFGKENGDAFNNIGVMYRDGLGVAKNRKIAYDLFLIVHMAGLGSEATISRANSNLRREVAEQQTPEIQEAVCYSLSYVMEYVTKRGAIEGVPDNLKPTEKNPRLRDANWWTKTEKDNMKFDCPAPWNTAPVVTPGDR